MKNIKIPFDENNNLQSYPSYNTVWKDNYELKATIEFTHIVRGCSAARFSCVDINTKQKFQMFMKCFLEMFRASPSINNGIVSGTWTFCKRGQNYGLKFIKGEN